LLKPDRGLKQIRKGSKRYDVAFYVPWIGPLLSPLARSPTGGAETQIFLLARALAARGFRVCLIVFDLPGLDVPSRVGDVSVLVRPPYRTHEPLGKFRETLALGKAIMEADAGVMVARAATPDIGLVGLSAKLLRRRFVYSSANVSDFDYRLVASNRRNRELFRLGIRLADEIIVQTAEQARLCEEHFRRSPVLIGSIAEPAPQRDRNPEAFLWIGRLVWYKRPFEFVELARSLPSAKFWMVGVPAVHGDEGAELAREVEREVATVPNLQLLAPRPRPELMNLIERAVAVVNTADFEGMPNIFLEGWARGVPALTLTHDPDSVVESHSLGGFAHGSSRKLREIALALWEGRTKQTDVGARCRQYILEHHSPEIVSGHWEKALRLVPSARQAS
jgi:glycosyltransferase involved in cell wall biosynthesis